MTLNQQDRSCSEDAPRARQIEGTVNSDDIGSANSIQTNSRFVMSIRRFIFLEKKRNVVRFQICFKKKIVECSDGQLVIFQLHREIK